MPPTKHTFSGSIPLPLIHFQHLALIHASFWGVTPPSSHTFLAKSEGVNPPLMFIHYQKCMIHPPCSWTSWGRGSTSLTIIYYGKSPFYSWVKSTISMAIFFRWAQPPVMSGMVSISSPRLHRWFPSLGFQRSGRFQRVDLQARQSCPPGVLGWNFFFRIIMGMIRCY